LENFASIAPSHESAFDDLIFYLTQPLSNYPVELSSDIPSLIMRKFVVAHYFSLVEYLKTVLSSTEYRLAKSGLQSNQVKSFKQWTESSWSDIFAWSRRISDYCERIDDALDTLNISRSMSTDAARSWSSCDEDFRYVRRRLWDMKKRTNDLVLSLNGVISIIEIKRSLEEAKSLKTLTILGMLFVPLSFSSTLFSMNQAYIPGGSHFWVYLAVAIPLVLVTILAVLGTSRKACLCGQGVEFRVNN